MEHIYDVAIVGGGIAGYSAALTAKSLGLDCLWIGAERFGGKTRAAEYVRNYPAFMGNGAAFSEALERQRGAEDVPFLQSRVDGIFRMETYLLSAGKESYRAAAVILATGVEKQGGIRGEREFFGRGVSYCAVCDGALYRGKTVAVILFSPNYAEEVEYLAGFAETVHCFTLCDVTFGKKNIVVHGGMPDEIAGGARVETVVQGGKALPVSGVFLLKDSAPVQALCGGLATDGVHVTVQRDLSTNLAGLFAAGDVTGTPYQFAKAAGEGLVAAYSVKKYLRTVRAKAGSSV